jgi:hypothetical protein
MISTETGLRTSREALLHLQNALADLERERKRHHPANFAVMAEPIQDEIQKIEREIADFERSRLAGQSNGDPSGLANRCDVKV